VRRERAHRQRAIVGPAALEAVSETLRNAPRFIAILHKLGSPEVIRASEQGIVEIADVRQGDVVPPFGRVALLGSADRWIVRAYPVDPAPATWRAGTPVHVLLAAGKRLDATIQSTGKAITATVVSTRMPVEPGASVQVVP
jgi:hypothetical protein